VDRFAAIREQSRGHLDLQLLELCRGVDGENIQRGQLGSARRRAQVDGLRGHHLEQRNHVRQQRQRNLGLVGVVDVQNDGLALPAHPPRRVELRDNLLRLVGLDHPLVLGERDGGTSAGGPHFFDDQIRGAAVGHHKGGRRLFALANLAHVDIPLGDMHDRAAIARITRMVVIVNGDVALAQDQTQTGSDNADKRPVRHDAWFSDFPMGSADRRDFTRSICPGNESTGNHRLGLNLRE
jgi:hypothetical protein